MGLRDTYAYAIQTAKGKFQGNAEEREGKLYFQGTVATEAEKNDLWNAIKTIPTWERDIVADIKVTGGAATTPGTATATAKAPAAPQGGGTYTVKAGDTLTRIAATELKDMARWKEIWDLNRDRVANENLIYPRLVLLMP